MAVYAIGDVQGCATELEALLRKIKFDARARPPVVRRRPRQPRARLARGAAPGRSAGRRRDRRARQSRPAPARGGSRRRAAQEARTAASRRCSMPRTAAGCSTGCNRARCCITTPGSASRWCMRACRRSGICRPRSAARASSRRSLRSQRDGRVLPSNVRRQARSLARRPRGRRAAALHRQLPYAAARLRCGGASLRWASRAASINCPTDVMPWFRVPGRRTAGARIVCGHWSALGYLDENGVASIDTGCVWGGSLTALRLDRPAGPVQVPASKARELPAED